MKTRLSSRFIIIWLVIGIPLLSYLFFKKTFNLALYGDDWLQLYNLWLSFDIHKQLSFFDIKSYLGAYMPQYFFLGIIRYVFGYEAQAYFAASLLLRIFSTISLFFLVREFTKNWFASFLSSIIFLFSAAGLQTTDWVFNMNTYAGIFFLNLAIIVYLKMRQLKTFISWYYLIYILLLALALGVVPVRMHGALPFIVFIEFFLFTVLEKNSLLKVDRFLIARITISVMVMIMLVKAGSYGSDGDITPQLGSSFLYLQDMIQKGRYDIFFYFPGIIGNIVTPDSINLGKFFGSSIMRLLIFSLLGFFITFTTRGGKNMYIAVIILNIFSALFGKLLTLWNPALPLAQVFSISVGLQTIFLSLFIFAYTQKEYPQLSSSIVIGLLWIIFFSLLYWLRTPYLIIETTGRYMTMGAVGFSILFASILSIMFNSCTKKNSLTLIIIIFIFTSWLGINFMAGQTYLTNLEINRNLTLADRTWSALMESVPTLDQDAPSVFYFTYDNSVAADMVLIFGFWPHAGLSYGISNWEKTPLPTDNYPQLLEMVRTGEPLKKVHAREAKPVPLSRVFAFDFKNGQLVSTTDTIRQQLARELKAE